MNKHKIPDLTKYHTKIINRMSTSEEYGYLGAVMICEVFKMLIEPDYSCLIG